MKMKESEKSNYEEIGRFLSEIEQVTEPISEFEISKLIGEFIKERFKQRPPEILIWEQMAFDFLEGYSNDRAEQRTYFSPKYVLMNEEGKLIEYPSTQKIIPATISYWEKRAEESNHPIFKARYSNLVWDFSEKIKKEKPHYTITQIFIDSVMEIAEKDLHESSMNVIKKLECALFIALSINDNNRINKLIDTIIGYEEKIAEDSKVGTWGFSYKLLINNKKINLSTDKEQKIVRDLEERYERILKNNGYWPVKNAAILLADYYFKLGNSEKVKNVLSKLENMIQAQLNQNISFVTHARLRKLYSLYLKHALKDEAKNVLIKIEELDGRVISEIPTIEIPFEISQKEIETLIEELIEGNLEEALRKIAVYYIPRKNETIDSLKNLFQKYPLSFLSSRQIFDSDGRMIATVGPLNDDLEGHVVFRISQDMQVLSFLLRKTINALIEKFNLNAKTVVEYFYSSPIFEEKRKIFLIKGIEAYLNNDFITAIHILIPQIEALIRNLAEKMEIPVLNQSHLNGFNYRSLSSLLEEESIKNILSEDVCNYLKILLSDPRGWNLRNKVCHGISKIDDFNRMVTNKILILL